jgi:hypothetical protein
MLEKIKKYRLVGGLLAVSIGLVIAGFLWAMLSLTRGNGLFILHFNDFQKITAISGTGLVVFMGIFGIVAVLLNGCLALEFEGRNPFFGKLTAVLTLAFAVLLFISFAAILSVN